MRNWRRGPLVLLAIMTMLATALAPAMADPGGNGVGHERGNGRGSGLPPGLERDAGLPPGLAGGDLPPGLATSVQEIQLISYSDWHGQVVPLDVFGEGVFGGGAALATYFDMERSANPNTIIVTGGDDFGASVSLSGFFDEVPAVLSQNLMGLDVSALGNHNFDLGTAHLAARAADADYTYVGANLTNLAANGLADVKPYEIFDLDGTKVAVIGVTNEEAPTLVFPGSFGTVEITDAGTAANAARSAAAAEGATVFVLVGHDGVRTVAADGSATGELIDLAESVDGFDVVLGDHTDVEFAGVVNGATVVENRSKGRTYARITLQVGVDGGPVLGASVEFVDPVTDAVVPDQSVLDMLAPFEAMLAAELDGVIGQTTGFWQRGGGYERIGESEAGNLMADSFRARYDTQIAFTNSGGIRSSLPSSGYTPADPTVDRDGSFPDDLVLGDVFDFHTFGNEVLTRTVTGTTLHSMLEHGLGALPGADGRFPAVAGIRVIYDSAAAAGSRVVSVALDDGTPVAADGTSYTIAVNDFINAGGDDYVMLADGEGTTRELVTDVVAAHIIDLGTITPFFDCRLIDINPTGPAAGRQDCSVFLP